jgi:transcriptional regulator with XRE-family HTH domain
MPRTHHSPELVAAGRRLAFELAEARRRRGVPAARVAEAAGLSVDAIRRIEAGRVTNPGFLTVAAIADIVDVPLASLVAAAKDEGGTGRWPRQHD